MPTISEMKAGHSLEWTTDLPDDVNKPLSPGFRIRGVELCFTFKMSIHHFDLELKCLNEASRSRFVPFDALVYGQLTSAGESHSIYGPRTLPLCVGNFLSIGFDDIRSAMKEDFRYHQFITFFVLFESADAPTILNNAAHKSVQTPAYFDAHFKLQSLTEDLNKMLEDGSGKDVELVCRGRTFTAHRSLLSARSDVFRAMLGSEMAEGKTGRVQIEDVEAETFEQFLQYLYKGKLHDLTLDIALQLYQLGDKYAVEPLKRQCVSFFSENLTQDNACNILSLAERHSDRCLKEITTTYLVEQRIPLRDDSSHWSDFSTCNPAVALEVMTQLCKKIASLQVSSPAP